MLLTVFVQITYANVLQWMVRGYYYSHLGNEGICLILAIHTSLPSSLNALYT